MEKKLLLNLSTCPALTLQPPVVSYNNKSRRFNALGVTCGLPASSLRSKTSRVFPLSLVSIHRPALCMNALTSLFFSACPMMIAFLLAGLGVLPLICAVAPGHAGQLLTIKYMKPSLERRQDASEYPAHTIDMPIDHFPNNPRYAPHTNATFSQRYYFDSTYYKPGGPVYLYIGGETSGPSRFSNLETGIIQILMNATNGLGVILENRYYGESYPYGTSTTDQLAYLTTEQTIADNAYFATHATFPGIKGNISAPTTPWILYGGSLAGAQTAFSIKQYGGLLYGGIASSAVIHAVLAYPEWYAPIQKFAPQGTASVTQSRL